MSPRRERAGDVRARVRVARDLQPHLADLETGAGRRPRPVDPGDGQVLAVVPARWDGLRPAGPRCARLEKQGDRAVGPPWNRRSRWTIALDAVGRDRGLGDGRLGTPPRETLIESRRPPAGASTLSARRGGAGAAWAAGAGPSWPLRDRRSGRNRSARQLLAVDVEGRRAWTWAWMPSAISVPSFCRVAGLFTQASSAPHPVRFARHGHDVAHLGIGGREEKTRS
jgi:hypothetical protein